MSILPQPKMKRGRSYANSNVRKVSMAVRRQEFLQLKVAGLSNYQIAERYDCDSSLVSREITKALGELAELNQEGADQMRQVQTMRYNCLLQPKWAAALRGDESAFDKVIRVLDRLNSIWGLCSNRPIVAVDARNQRVNLCQNSLDTEPLTTPERMAAVIEILSEAGVLPPLPGLDAESEALPTLPLPESNGVAEPVKG